jgi:hypothetical protein
MVVGGETRFFITGSTSNLRNANRRRALARGQALLAQVRDCLASEVPKSVVESLDLSNEWIASECERMSAKPKQLIGGDNDAT